MRIVDRMCASDSEVILTAKPYLPYFHAGYYPYLCYWMTEHPKLCDNNKHEVNNVHHVHSLILEIHTKLKETHSEG